MTNKGINPLFISALDILTGALGVFIVLNFLNARLPQDPNVIEQAQIAEKKSAKEGKEANAKTYAGSQQSRVWWRKPPEPPRPSGSEGSENTSSPTNNNQPSEVIEQINPPNPPSMPQDPVAVDLMKQTKGAVVLLLQQADKSKASVELMLRQGNMTWKPSRASKYQDNTFQYMKGVNYFYQTEIHPGTYEVLVRIKRGQKSAEAQPFSLFGKIIPPGQRSQTYAFGAFDLGGAQSEWTSAGTFTVGGNSLGFKPRLSPSRPRPAGSPDQPPVAQPRTEPAAKQKGKTGKWG